MNDWEARCALVCEVTELDMTYGLENSDQSSHSIWVTSQTLLRAWVFLARWLVPWSSPWAIFYFSRPGDGQIRVGGLRAATLLSFCSPKCHWLSWNDVKTLVCVFNTLVLCKSILGTDTTKILLIFIFITSHNIWYILDLHEKMFALYAVLWYIFCCHFSVFLF